MKQKLFSILCLSALLGLGACQKADSGSTFSSGSGTTNNMAAGGGASSKSAVTTGKGGSLARFTIAGSYLYIVDAQRLYAYSLANPSSPALSSSIDVGMDIETIYSYKDLLFIGSRNAMYIYSLANPAQPLRQGMASHVRACDPVVAGGNVAYVTVRSGSGCGGTVSALIVYDVTNIQNPIQRKQINLNGPYGLGLGNDRLYVCDGSSGLKVYNTADVLNPVELKTFTDDTYYDVIVHNDLLLALIEGGMSIYRIQPGDELVHLARLTD